MNSFHILQFAFTASLFLTVLALSAVLYIVYREPITPKVGARVRWLRRTKSGRKYRVAQAKLVAIVGDFGLLQSQKTGERKWMLLSQFKKLP